VTAPAEILELLVTQVTGMVRWRESVLWMRDRGIERVVEIGPGKVLSGLARRIDPDLQSISLATVEDIDTFL
jgi:[acyl-carrier-protein] S-malonyltransferase